MSGKITREEWELMEDVLKEFKIKLKEWGGRIAYWKVKAEKWEKEVNARLKKHGLCVKIMPLAISSQYVPLRQWRGTRYGIVKYVLWRSSARGYTDCLVFSRTERTP